MATKKELEAERKFDVHQDQLPKDMGEPWVIVQAHRRMKDGRDQSLRLIPSCKKAFLRVKDTGFGIRHKESTELAMNHAMELLKDAKWSKNVALKYRYMLLDGRGWIIDHFPEHNRIQAETEFKSPEEFWQRVETPAFAGRDITFEDGAYTRDLGKPRTAKEIMHMIALAKKHGCKESYDPDKLFAAAGRDGDSGPSNLKPVT